MKTKTQPRPKTSVSPPQNSLPPPHSALRAPCVIEKIIWDADNTFWNWVRYAAKAYQAMADCIALESKLPEEKIAQAMKRFYSRAGTMEDAGLIQGLEADGLFSKAHDYNRENLIAKVRESFNEMRSRYFKTYANIGQILSAAHAKGKENIVLSDAPGVHATQRLIHSKLHLHISRVYARQSAKIDDLPPDVRTKMRAGGYNAPFEVIEIKDEKPDTNLEEILRLHESPAKNAEYIRNHVAIIGDNRAKDMALAEKWGCLGLHALWGHSDPQDLATLAKFAPASVTARNAATQTSPANNTPGPNIIAVTHPLEIMQILKL
jgi:phosphoglycolate phosphatase-like HAD superfamily hydrolase